MLDQQTLVHSAYSLKPLPASANRLAVLVVQSDPDLREIVEVVTYDPVLTAKLLRLANSAFLNRQYPANSVKAAILRLGTGMVLGVAMSDSTRSLVTATLPGYDILGEEFWCHAVTSAMFADVARLYSLKPWSPAGFTAALIHDVGKLVLGRFLSAQLQEQLREAELQGLKPYQAEQQILGIHHAEVGALVAKHWKLPDDIVQAVSFHHNPEGSEDPLASVLHFANDMAKQLMPTPDAPIESFPGMAQDLEKLQLSQECLGKINAQVRVRLKALGEQYGFN